MKHVKIYTIISFVITLLLIVLLTAMVFGLPTFLEWYYTEYGLRDVPRAVKRITVPFYFCAPAGYIILGLLAKLLDNVRKDSIFTMQNVTLFRIISVCALYVGVICICFGWGYIPLTAISFAALFIALLLQVLICLLATACRIAEENSLTI
ncbi:MAG: DUF2975 domain-containing protein [Clostridia bacterium]|nr:DUF2975 domain-containing protein [Clostridia bacterium]